MGNSTAAAAAEAALADIFTDILMAGGATFASFEGAVLAEGHRLMARAMGRALERMDAALCASLRVHDVRERSLATTVGDVSFRWRRLRGPDGAGVVPLADELDLPWGARASPAAESFLVEAGAEVPYAAAARLLARAGGSRVSAKTAMLAVHAAGERCAAGATRSARWRRWGARGPPPPGARRVWAPATSRPGHPSPGCPRRCAMLPPSTPGWPERAGRRSRGRCPHQSHAVTPHAERTGRIDLGPPCGGDIPRHFCI